MSDEQYWDQRLQEFLDYVRETTSATDPTHAVASLRTVVSRWISHALGRQTHPGERNEKLLSEWVTNVLVLDVKPQRDYRSRVGRWWKWCESNPTASRRGEGTGHQTDVRDCWVVRAGRGGEAVNHNLENGVVTIGWGDWGDWSNVAHHESREEFREFIDERFAEQSESNRRSASEQIWRFSREIKADDLVVMPMRREEQDANLLAIGRIEGPFEFDATRPDLLQLRRSVTWLRTGIERQVIEEDLRNSIDAAMTVFGLRRHDAARRVHHLARHGFDPGLREEKALVDQGQSMRLAQLVAEFRAVGYPRADDHQHELARAGFEQMLRSLPETAYDDREVIKVAWNPAEFDYGSVGYAGAGANKLVNKASEDEWPQIRNEFAQVCFGNEDEATRLDRAAVSGILSGVRYVVGTRLLAICQPHDVIPIYLLRKSRKYPGVIDMIETLHRLDLISSDDRQLAQELCALPDSSLNSGAVVMQANDLLLETLRPCFSDDGDVDTWGMSKFLYWLMERDPSDDGTVSEWISASELAELSEELLCDVSFLEEVVALLEDKGQIILYGPPGTGKTHFARALAVMLTLYEDSADDGAYSLVQFHPAYSYEDFFEGFRPQVDGSGQMTYKLIAGPLVRLARRAKKHQDELHVMVIDEINRANLPRVLGELLYLLEYREDEIHTQYRPKRKFSLPKNLWFIGTMNTADRSIALIDAAMRRRFHFVKFSPNDEPTRGLLRRWLEQHAPSKMWVAGLLDGVNEGLATELGDGHLLVGPSHFMTADPDRDLTEEGLRLIWTHNIEPLVEDQFFGRQETIGEFRFHEVWARYGPDATSPDVDSDSSDAVSEGDGKPPDESEGAEGHGDG